MIYHQSTILSICYIKLVKQWNHYGLITMKSNSNNLWLNGIIHKKIIFINNNNLQKPTSKKHKDTMTKDSWMHYKLKLPWSKNNFHDKMRKPSSSSKPSSDLDPLPAWMTTCPSSGKNSQKQISPKDSSYSPSIASNNKTDPKTSSPSSGLIFQTNNPPNYPSLSQSKLQSIFLSNTISHPSKQPKAKKTIFPTLFIWKE